MRKTQSRRPPEAVSGALLAWLAGCLDSDELVEGLYGRPDEFIDQPERWEIGVVDAYADANDASAKIWLSFQKPDSHPEGDNPITRYAFSPATVWLLQAHLLDGGKMRVEANRNGAYYYLIIRIGGQDFRVARLITNAGPNHDVKFVGDHHDYTPENLKSMFEGDIAAQHGPEHERLNVVEGKSSREDAIGASIKQWRPGGIFSSPADYEAALRKVYAMLDRGRS